MQRRRSECRYGDAVAIVEAVTSTSWVAEVTTPEGTTYSPRCSFRTEAMAWVEQELERVVRTP